MNTCTRMHVHDTCTLELSFREHVRTSNASIGGSNAKFWIHCCHPYEPRFDVAWLQYWLLQLLWPSFCLCKQSFSLYRQCCQVFERKADHLNRRIEKCQGGSLH